MIESMVESRIESGKRAWLRVAEMRRSSLAGFVSPAPARLLCGLLLAARLAAASACAAQTPQAPSAADTSLSPATSRVEIVGAFSSWNPSGSVGGIHFNTINAGSMLGGSYYFSPHWGAQFEAGLHPEASKDGDQTFSVGPVRRFQVSGSTVFVHLLMGGTRLTGPNLPTLGGAGYFYNGCQWGNVIALGGGVDHVIPRTHGRLAVRFLQADYQHIYVNYGPLTSHGGGTAQLEVIRLDSGLVIRLGKM
jgi:hypothetical protein